MFVDSHIHLTHHLFDHTFPCLTRVEEGIIVYEGCNKDTLISIIKEAGCEFVVEPGIGVESNAKILEFASTSDGFVLPAIGVHPTRCIKTKWSQRKIIEELSNNDQVVAIGELGLDYHIRRNEQKRLKQMAWFIWQLKLADKLKLPLILHIRLADKDAIRILKYFHRKGKVHGGVCHCYNSGSDVAKIYTEEMGLMLGIGASLMYGNKELEEAVINTPLEFILLETDGPYVSLPKTSNLSNKEYRKIRNTSIAITVVAARIAELKGIEVSEVMRVTTLNAKKLFGVK